MNRKWLAVAIAAALLAVALRVLAQSPPPGLIAGLEPGPRSDQFTLRVGRPFYPAPLRFADLNLNYDPAAGSISTCNILHSEPNAPWSIGATWLMRNNDAAGSFSITLREPVDFFTQTVPGALRMAICDVTLRSFAEPLTVTLSIGRSETYTQYVASGVIPKRVLTQTVAIGALPPPLPTSVLPTVTPEPTATAPPLPTTALPTVSPLPTPTATATAGVVRIPVTVEVEESVLVELFRRILQILGVQ